MVSIRSGLDWTIIEQIRKRIISLSRIQGSLQDIYELDIAHNVNDYLVTSRAWMQQVDSGASNKHAREKLLIHEDEQGLNLSLYLDETILTQFGRHNPLEQLDHRNIQEFCLALEGISHFIYLVWNASYDRTVTLLEMELQAEVDKFIMLMNCLELQSCSPAPGQLTRLLFESNRYHEDLSGEEQKRYREATFYAKKYCQHLESHYSGRQNRAGLLMELRRFYRLNKPGKLKQIIRSH
ncbi:MAG: hypothetical protein WD709_01920 [Gammaproteobacteria bacterium]